MHLQCEAAIILFLYGQQQISNLAHQKSKGCCNNSLQHPFSNKDVEMEIFNKPYAC